MGELVKKIGIHSGMLLQLTHNLTRIQIEADASFKLVLLAIWPILTLSQATFPFVILQVNSKQLEKG